MPHFAPTRSILRRDVLHVGALSALGLSLHHFGGMSKLAAEDGPAKRAGTGKARACILVWLDGGPSHLETFDPKPESPSEVRGPLETLGTKVAGVRFSECLPRLAAQMDRFAVVRSVTSPLGEHNFGTHYMMTGYKPSAAIEYPVHGAVLAHLSRQSEASQAGALPPFVAAPNFRVGGSKLRGSGYLSRATAPFSIESDPASSDFKVRDLELYRGLDARRLQRRRSVSEALQRFANDANQVESELDPDLARAFDLVASADAKQAFDLTQESDATRQMYGRKSIGASCLLARRLVERGVQFVTVNNRGWDTHDNLVTRLKDGYSGARIPVGLAPSMDQAVSGLLEDLHQRGMLDETLVVVMGEFGRTPKLNTRGGRDHWPRVFSVMMAGGGTPGGAVIGASDAVGESPKEQPITPSDLAATIFTKLGIDPATELTSGDGRPIRLTPADATAISDLVS